MHTHFNIKNCIIFRKKRTCPNQCALCGAICVYCFKIYYKLKDSLQIKMSTTDVFLSRKRNHDDQIKPKSVREMLKDLTYAFATSQTKKAAQLSKVLAERQINVVFECDHTERPSTLQLLNNSRNSFDAAAASIVYVFGDIFDKTI